MSLKFQTTQSPEEQPGNMGERMQAQALAVAFAVLGKMIGEGWIHVNFEEQDWQVELRLQAQTIAEVLYDYE